MSAHERVYLATVLLEKNRWTPERIPSFEVSTWATKFACAGFDGIELWEHHATCAEQSEQQALETLPIPIKIFNSYCTFDDAGSERRDTTATFAAKLGVDGIKFNLGHEKDESETYLRNLRAWRDSIPQTCRLLCECHGGTILEDPIVAAKLLAPFKNEVEIIVHAFNGDDDEFLKSCCDQFGTAITHVHVARMNSETGTRPLRESEDLVARRIEILRAAGFSGTWSIEFTAGVATPSEDMELLLESAVDDMVFLREQLK